MKTADNVEIKINDYVYNTHGEELLVSELFPEVEGQDDKLIVIPQFHVESMYASCDGGYHHEIDTECEFEAEEKIIEAKYVFSKAPTAKICIELAKKKDELKSICADIGLAKVIKLKAIEEQMHEGAKLKTLKETFSATKTALINKTNSYLSGLRDAS